MEQLDENNWKLNKNQSLQRMKNGEYRIIAPFTKYDPETKSYRTNLFDFKNYNWYNFLTGGSISRLITVIVIVLCICFVVWAYKFETKQCMEFNERLTTDPVGFCSEITLAKNDPFQVQKQMMKRGLNGSWGEEPDEINQI
jgi:hypothetical protein